MELYGGVYNAYYDFMSPTSKVQLERGWSDPIGQRSATLIESDPYGDVITTLPLTIVAESEAEAWREYNKLATFVQEIAQFRLKPDRYPIVFGIGAVAGTDPVYTLCAGSADYNPRTPIINQPPALLDDIDGMWRIRGIRVIFRRKARLIKAQLESASVLLGNGPINHREAYLQFATDYPTDSPIESISLTYTPSGAGGDIPGGQILVSNPYLYSAVFGGISFESYQFLNGRFLGTSAPLGFSVLADTVASTNPMSYGSTNISRWIAVDNEPVEKTGSPGAITTFQNFIALGLVRSDTIGATATMQFFLQNSFDGSRIYGKVMPIIGDQIAKVINFGPMAVPTDWDIGGFLIGVIYRNTSTALSTIWLDTFISVNTDVANLAYFEHGPIYQTAATLQAYGITQRYLSATTPIMTGSNGGDNVWYPQNSRGSMHVNRKSQNVRLLWLTPGGQKWQTVTQAVTVVAGSYPATLTPSGEV